MVLLQVESLISIGSINTYSSDFIGMTNWKKYEIEKHKVYVKNTQLNWEQGSIPPEEIIWLVAQSLLLTRCWKGLKANSPIHSSCDKSTACIESVFY